MRGDGGPVVRVRLFGEIEVTGPLGTTHLAGNKQRAILARLALDAGRVVSVDELVDGVWGWDAPEAVRSAVQVHVSHIRRALRSIGVGEILATRSPGYVMSLASDAIDICRFEHLANAATSARGDPERVLRTSREAGALWRGVPLSAVGSAPYATAVRSRLDGRRIDLACATAAAALDLGRPTEVLPDVEALSVEHPFSEPLWIAMSRLLHAAGRHHEALARLATLRRTLSDELGLLAGPEVGDVELRILMHDPAVGQGRSGAVDVVRSVPHVPPPQTPVLWGRDQLVERLARAVAEPGLVTLIGAAGVGKTSVAAHIARLDEPRRKFAPVFVDLAALDPRQEVEPSVAAAIGLRPSGAEEVGRELLAALGDRDQLIVLDNCEHVIEHAANFVTALAEAPELTVVATSRVPLGCRHECVIHVPPLDPEVLTDLFVDRARSASSTFDPDGEDGAIEILVGRLDGLPLGVELVAPLVRSMSPAEILSQTDLLGVVTGTHSTVDRHRSLADAIGWSVGLLGPGERTLLARFAAFASGAFAPSIQDVCSDVAGDPSIVGEDVLVLLRSLVDASVVTTERTPSGTWYRMLFPIREEAERLLRLDPAASAAVAARHARHIVGLVESACRDLAGARPLLGMRQIERQAPEIRRAHAHFAAVGDRLGTAKLLDVLGPPAVGSTAALPESRAWLGRLIEELGGLDPVAGLWRRELSDGRWLHLLISAARLGDLDAETHATVVRAAFDLAVELGDRPSEIVAHSMLAEVVSDTDVHAGADHGLASVELARRHDDPVLEAYAIVFAANMTMRARRLDDAAALLADVVSGDTARFAVLESNVLYQVGRLWMLQGDLSGASSMFERSERAARAVGSMSGLSYAVFGRCDIARRQGRLVEALELARASSDLDRLVAPRDEWMGLDRVARIGVLLADEPAVAEAVSRLTRGTSRHACVALEAARGCLASCRGARSVAVSHLRRALEMCASMNAVEYFADNLETYAYVSSSGDGPRSIGTFGDAVRAGDVSLAEALARLAP